MYASYNRDNLKGIQETVAPRPNDPIHNAVPLATSALQHLISTAAFLQQPPLNVLTFSSRLKMCCPNLLVLPSIYRQAKVFLAHRSSHPLFGVKKLIYIRPLRTT